jgi:hypothetical protein
MPDPAYPWIKDRSGMLPEDLEINFNDDFTRINDFIFGDLDADSYESPVEVPAETPVDPVFEVGNSEPVADLAQEPEAEPLTGVPVADVQKMTVPEKLKVPAPFPCEECETYFDVEDQRDMSVLSKHRKILCGPCYKALNKK